MPVEVLDKFVARQTAFQLHRVEVPRVCLMGLRPYGQNKRKVGQFFLVSRSDLLTLEMEFPNPSQLRSAKRASYVGHVIFKSGRDNIIPPIR